VRDSEWKAYLGLLAMTWPREVPTESVRAFMRQQLDGLPDGAVLASLKSFIAEGREFAPNWGQVQARAREMTGERPPSFPEVLTEVLEQIRLTDRKAQWSSPAVALFVERMGWHELRWAPERDAFGWTQWATSAERVWRECVEHTQAGIAEPRRLGVPESVAMVMSKRDRALEEGNLAYARALDGAIARQIEAEQGGRGGTSDEEAIGVEARRLANDHARRLADRTRREGTVVHLPEPRERPRMGSVREQEGGGGGGEDVGGVVRGEGESGA
jgi:hypothetical protein